MSALTWDAQGKRNYRVGVSKVVLYPDFEDGHYTNGVAWNGVTAVDESPDGAEANAFYADNIKYASIRSAENNKGSISAYDFPNALHGLDGRQEIEPGLVLGQQPRVKRFGFCYRTEIGNDANAEAGYELHLVYNASLSPSEKSHETQNENPDLMEMDWDYDCLPSKETVKEESWIEETSSTLRYSTNVSNRKWENGGIVDAVGWITHNPGAQLPITAGQKAYWQVNLWQWLSSYDDLPHRVVLNFNSGDGWADYEGTFVGFYQNSTVTPIYEFGVLIGKANPTATANAAVSLKVSDEEVTARSTYIRWNLLKKTTTRDIVVSTSSMVIDSRNVANISALEKALYGTEDEVAVLNDVIAEPRSGSLFAAIQRNNTTGTWSGENYTVNGVTFTVRENMDDGVSLIMISGTPTASAELVIYKQSATMATGGGNAFRGFFEYVPQTTGTVEFNLSINGSPCANNEIYMNGGNSARVAYSFIVDTPVNGAIIPHFEQLTVTSGTPHLPTPSEIHNLINS